MVLLSKSQDSLAIKSQDSLEILSTCYLTGPTQTTHKGILCRVSLYICCGKFQWLWARPILRFPSSFIYMAFVFLQSSPIFVNCLKTFLEAVHIKYFFFSPLCLPLSFSPFLSPSFPLSPHIELPTSPPTLQTKCTPLWQLPRHCTTSWVWWGRCPSMATRSWTSGYTSFSKPT